MAKEDLINCARNSVRWVGGGGGGGGIQPNVFMTITITITITIISQNVVIKTLKLKVWVYNKN